MSPLLLATLLLAQNPPTADDSNRHTPVSYANEVADILLAKCVGCHNAAEPKGKLSLEDPASMKKGGKRGPALVPGNAQASRLFRLASRAEKPFMPPPDNPASSPLSPAELDRIKLWIDQGAADDSSPTTPPTESSAPTAYKPIYALDMTDDGSRIASARGDTIEFFDADTGLNINTFTNPAGTVHSLRLSPDGRFLAAGSHQTVTLWTCPTVTESPTFSKNSAPASFLALASDGALLLAAHHAEKHLQILDPATGALKQSIPLPAEAVALAVSPKATRLAAGLSNGQVVCLDLRGTNLATLNAHAAAVHSVLFLDDDTLVSASDDSSCLVHAIPPAPEFAIEPPLSFKGHSGNVLALQKIDDRAIASASTDGSIQLWNPRSGEIQATIHIPHDDQAVELSALAYDATREHLWAGCSNGQLLRINPDSAEIEASFASDPSRVLSIALDHDGTRVVSTHASGAVIVRERPSGALLTIFAHPAPKKGDPLPPATASAFLRDGRLITASQAGPIKCWGVAGRWSPWKTLSGHADRVLALDFNPDGSLLAAAAGEPTRGGQLTLWETGKGMRIRRWDNAHTDSIFGARFSPDGSKIATASADRFVKIFQVATGRELHALEGHSNHVLAVDWSADGKQVVSAGADNVLKFWDAELGETLRSTEPIDKQITAARWPRGPGTPVVVSASGDQTVRFWNPANSQVTRSFEGAGNYIYGLAIAVDRTRVAAGDADGALLIWNGANGQLQHKIEPDR